MQIAEGVFQQSISGQGEQCANQASSWLLLSVCVGV